MGLDVLVVQKQQGIVLVVKMAIKLIQLLTNAQLALHVHVMMASSITIQLENVKFVIQLV